MSWRRSRERNSGGGTTMELHAPRVNTFVQIPAYGIEHPLSINFMLDTGSAHTIISPEMSSELGIQKGKPTCRVTSVDCSTKIDCVRLKTIICFSVQSNSGEPERRGLETEILAEVGKESNWGKNDSLLGRDILQDRKSYRYPPITTSSSPFGSRSRDTVRPRARCWRAMTW